MEKNKYYTPDIKEFRVGFEFETRVSSFEEEWGKDKLYAEFKDGWTSNVDETLAAYEDGYLEFRVKLLDKEDIESFGFKYIESTENGVNFIKHIYNPKQSIHLTLFNTNHRVGIAVYNFNIEPPMAYEEVGTFGGTIKNKSELKQMFKVLGVIE